MQKTSNIVITGVGGQGLVTLLQLIAQTALNEGYDVKTSELHGLSQRGGSVSVYIRFGPKVFSPVVAKGKADFVLALEYQEALAGFEFASSKTVFLVNKHQTPTLGRSVAEKEVEKTLKTLTKKVFFVPATEICQNQFKNSVVAGIFLLGLAAAKEYIPLSVRSLSKTVKEIMPLKYQELNIKTLEFAKSYGEK